MKSPKPFFTANNLYTQIWANYLDGRSLVVVDHLEGEVADVLLDLRVRPAPPDQPFGVEHRVPRVGGQLRKGGKFKVASLFRVRQF